MAQTIFDLLSVVLGLFMLYCIVVAILGTGYAALWAIGTSLIFWGALVGGLVGFMFTQGSVDALIIGAVIGGIIGGLINHGTGSLFKIILWTIVGVAIGYSFGMMIVFGIIGFVVGLIRC